MKSSSRRNKIRKRLRIKQICKERKKTEFWMKLEKEKKQKKKQRPSNKN